MNYIGVARRKITRLIEREDCLGVMNSDDDKLTIRFEFDSCTIDKWGRVIWLNPDADRPEFSDAERPEFYNLNP